VLGVLMISFQVQKWNSRKATFHDLFCVLKIDCVSIIINYSLDHADVGSTDCLVVEDFSFFFFLLS
jgi:hypothetical protein